MLYGKSLAMIGGLGNKMSSHLQLPKRQPRIKGPIISLRPWRQADAPAVFTACQDLSIQRYTAVPVPYLIEHAQEFVTTLSHSQWEQKVGACFAIVDNQSKQLLGSCSLMDIDQLNLNCEIGYWISPDFRGQKIGQTALSLISSWAINNCNFKRLELMIEPDNIGSIKIAEQSDYQFEGTMSSKILLRGIRRDMNLYSRLG